MNILQKIRDRITLQRRMRRSNQHEEIFWAIQESFDPIHRPRVYYGDLGEVIITATQANTIMEWLNTPGSLDRKKNLIAAGARTPNQVTQQLEALTDDELATLVALRH